jgi:ABC-type uncharacterized transport system involved in gliding motility auxiliary subunit
MGLVLWLTVPLTLAIAGPGPLVDLKALLGAVLIVAYLSTNRDFFSRVRKVRASSLFALSALASALVLALVVGVNVFAYNHPKDFDFTREGIYTLSPQTVGVLHRLNEPVTILAFFGSQEPAFAPVEETLQRYARQSAHLKAQMIDPQARPDLVKKYNITERGPRVVITAERSNARAKNLSEEEITNAIVQAVAQTHKTVSFLVGHGEGDLDNERDPEGFALFAKAIETEGYIVKTLNLMASAPATGSDAQLPHGSGAQHLESAEAEPLVVPQDVNVLVVLAPTHKLLAPEAQAIATYLQGGGRLYLLEEPQSQSGLEDVLADWHIGLRDDLIVDTSPVGRLLGLGVASPILHPLDDGHPMTQGITSVIMTTARSLVRLPKGHEQVVALPLLQSAETAWGETEVGVGGTIAKDDKDHLPPLYTAMAAFGSDDEDTAGPKGRVVAVGDSDWVSNRSIGLQNNADLAINAINWLAEEADRITIRPKLRAQSQLRLNDAQLSLIKFVSMDLLPVLLVALGLGISLVRRQR